MKWSYGVTTVPERKDLLNRTLSSLTYAGFGSPKVFEDGKQQHIGYSTNCTGEKLGAFGNWILALHELSIRDPHADFYVIFQDDIVTYRNLREYLELTCTQEDKVYWNLYTTPESDAICKLGHKGWFKSTQRGRGALGLVFNRQGVEDILSAPNIVKKPTTSRNPKSNLDGAVVHALIDSGLGYTELVHSPSLLQHTGDESIIKGHQTPHPYAKTFKGEGWDVMSLMGPTEPSLKIHSPEEENVLL